MGSAPEVEGPIALWLDGGLASAVAIALLSRHHPLTALLPAAPNAAALALAHRFATPLATPLPPPSPDAASLIAAAQLAASHGARTLAVPFAAADELPDGLPLALRLAETDAMLAAWGLGSLYAPLLRHGWAELGRLALALGLDPAAARGCPQQPPCGSCPICVGQTRALSAVGRRANELATFG